MRKIMKKITVYVLKSDEDGTTRSHDESLGVAVSSEAEAKRFVEEGGHGFTHSYEELVIFEDKDDAITHSKGY